MTAPGFEAVHAIGDPHDERHVVLDHQHRRTELALDAHDERSERLGFPLRDTAGRLVEEQHAGVDREQRAELDDAARAGRQVRHELVGVAAEAEEVDQLARLAPLAPFGRGRRRERRSSTARATMRSRASSATMIVSRTVSAGIQASGLEAAAEADAVPAVRGRGR